MSGVRIHHSDDASEVHIDYSEMATNQARNIVSVYLPEWLSLFLRKNKQYAHLAEATLGDRAMFVDVWRKVNALKLLIWDEEDAGTEPTEEIILDLIGHLFLILEYRARETSEDRYDMRSAKNIGGLGNTWSPEDFAKSDSLMGYVDVKNEDLVVKEQLYRQTPTGKFEPLG